MMEPDSPANPEVEHRHNKEWDYAKDQLQHKVAPRNPGVVHTWIYKTLHSGDILDAGFYWSVTVNKYGGYGNNETQDGGPKTHKKYFPDRHLRWERITNPSVAFYGYCYDNKCWTDHEKHVQET